MLISVIMPVFNDELFLKQSIESILNQTEKDFELIIVNDGSTDNSEKIILSFSDLRIRYFKKEHSGVSATRNFGIDNAKGDFIVLQDADDISLPNRFEILKRNFISPQIGLVHSDVMEIDENNNPITYWIQRNLGKQKALRYYLKIGTPITGASIMVRREVFNDLRYETSLSIGEDNYLLLHITEKWNSVHVPDVLYLYRIHSSKTITYEMFSSHINKILSEYSLQKLVPEINWETGNYESNKCRACAIIALFLFNRNMINHALKWINNSNFLALKPDDQKFAIGINLIMLGEYETSIKILQFCSNIDHIIENYIGENYALLGDRQKSIEHFFNSIKLCPNYCEPIENLKGLGGITKYSIGDTSYSKFLIKKTLRR